MLQDTTDWRDLREFNFVDLTESFVLSWHCEDGSLLLDLDLCLLPEHPFYDPPRRKGRHCIQPALLEFPACERFFDDARQAASAEPDRVAATLGHGKITDFRRIGEGRYRVSGPFGKVTVHSGRPILRLGNRPA